MFSGFVFLGFAQPELQTLEPQSPQRALIEKTLAELQEVALPEGVGDVVESLSQPVTFSFECPQGSAVGRVSVSVTTTLKAWDPAALRAQGSEGSAGRESGAYLWNGFIRTGNGETTMEFSNALLFDPRAFKEPQGPLGALTNQTLLYHELLHGQLLINAAQRDASWRENACAGEGPDLEAADANHEHIPALEQTLAQTLAENAPDVFALSISPEEADAHGNFSVALGPAAELLGGSRSFSVSFLFDTGSNVQQDETEVAFEGGEVVVTGRLADPARSGFMLLALEPG